MTNIVVVLGSVEWEPQLLGAFAHPMLNLTIQRRCVDAIDARSAVRTLDVDAVLVSDATLRINEDSIQDFLECGVRVIAISNETQKWQSLGVCDIVALDIAELSTMVNAIRNLLRSVAPVVVMESEPTGNLIAVTGFGGGSGRSATARELSYVSCMAQEKLTLLVDADTSSPSLAIALNDENVSRGLLALTRLAESNRLAEAEVAALTTSVFEQLWFARGLPTANRWSDLRPQALKKLWAHFRETFENTVVDVGPLHGVEGADYSYEVIPKRSAALLTTLDAATTVVLSARADNVGVTRLIRGYLDNEELLTDKEVIVHLHHATDFSSQAAHTILRHTGIQRVTSVEHSNGYVRAIQEHSFASAFDTKVFNSHKQLLDIALRKEEVDQNIDRQQRFLRLLSSKKAA